MKKWNIGCSGFYYREWKNLFYPPEIPQRLWFDYYCQNFNSVEINATFYRMPQIKSLVAWYDKSPLTFQFSVKVFQEITHERKFTDCEDLIHDFYTNAEKGLKEKLGCVLFQLPPSFQYSEDALTLICKATNPSFRNVMEFRHASWWRQNVYDRLGERNISFCSISYPKLPETIVFNTDFPYVRMHGVPKLYYSGYSDETLKTLADRLNEDPKIHQGFIYFNNTAAAEAITNARQLRQMLSD